MRANIRGKSNWKIFISLLRKSVPFTWKIVNYALKEENGGEKIINFNRKP
jgi:hypothetical protein